MSVTGDVHIGEIGFCPGSDVTLRRNDPAIPVEEAEDHLGVADIDNQDTLM